MKVNKKNQRFGVGDFARLDGKFNVRIVDCIKDEDGSWWYEVKPIDIDTPARFSTREVRQDQLEAI